MKLGRDVLLAGLLLLVVGMAVGSVDLALTGLVIMFAGVVIVLRKDLK